MFDKPFWTILHLPAATPISRFGDLKDALSSASHIVELAFDGWIMRAALNCQGHRLATMAGAEPKRGVQRTGVAPTVAGRWPAAGSQDQRAWWWRRHPFPCKRADFRHGAS